MSNAKRQAGSMTRLQAAARLRCSYSNVVRLEQSKAISSKKDINGAYLLRSSDVEARAAERGLANEAEREILAVSLIMSGASLGDVVLKSGMTTDQALELSRKLKHGFDYVDPKTERSERAKRERNEREHDALMRSLDQDIARRRQGVIFGEDLSPKERNSRATILDVGELMRRERGTFFEESSPPNGDSQRPRTGASPSARIALCDDQASLEAEFFDDKPSGSSAIADEHRSIADKDAVALRKSSRTT